ncbi:PhzF family phenazine biosynthesis protein [Paraburkholderia sp. BCC1885]|uniref:PhzF family phenazine biosynthesis protein n=1 Tax=Paraburkholderia sp. BCC1885 TaxID=2562669 RepID=UPI0011830678|nr:PhzF family phenazine biosynthesis isomerase [Paraburkholderia sp. BCC1885]
MKSNELYFVNVFAAGPQGGNPAPIVLHADALSDVDMKSIAQKYGHESAFVSEPVDPSHTFCFRFFVPNHEMEMCGHATLGALWLLRRLGRWTSGQAIIETKSGLVEARFDQTTQVIAVSQPNGIIRTVDNPSLVEAALDVLGLEHRDLLHPVIVNATTSRAKTLVAVKSAERLNTIRPRLEAVQHLCEALDSTGLYPFALDSERPLSLHARQFPRSSGYPEDAATGIAAAALLYGAKYYDLLSPEATGITVYQGFAMGRPSRISVSFREPRNVRAGCWMSGPVELTTLDHA